MEENNEVILQRIEYFEEKNETLFKSLLVLETKIDSLLEVDR